jgi:ABC-type multidrug transport system fused ATPase/permease subunit
LPDVVEQLRLCGSGRVQIVGLKQLWFGRHPCQQEVDQRGLVGCGDGAESLLEFSRVSTIVGRDALPDQEHLRLVLLGAADDGAEVCTQLCHRQATQAVVGAESDDHHLRRVLVQRRGDACAAAGGCFSRDAGIDDAIIELFLLQASGQQGWPGRILADTVARGKRIAKDQYGARRLCSRGKQQQSGEQQGAKYRETEHSSVLGDAAARVIEVRNLAKRVDSGGQPLTILHEISFAVAAGETVAIVGASGSGKSTLLGLMAGLDQPSEGSVTLAGENLAMLDEDARAVLRGRMLGFVFQTFQLLPSLTAIENVMLPLELAAAANASQ